MRFQAALMLKLMRAATSGTADKYSNLSAQYRRHTTDGDPRAASTTTIDPNATRSHRGVIRSNSGLFPLTVARAKRLVPALQILIILKLSKVKLKAI